MQLQADPVDPPDGKDATVDDVVDLGEGVEVDLPYLPKEPVPIGLEEQVVHQPAASTPATISTKTSIILA